MIIAPNGGTCAWPLAALGKSKRTRVDPVAMLASNPITNHRTESSFHGFSDNMPVKYSTRRRSDDGKDSSFVIRHCAPRCLRQFDREPRQTRTGFSPPLLLVGIDLGTMMVGVDQREDCDRQRAR